MKTNTVGKTAISSWALLDEAGPTLTVPQYARIVGISRDQAYRLVASGELGVRVLQLGRRMVIPTADVRDQLGLPRAPGGAA